MLGSHVRRSWTCLVFGRGGREWKLASLSTFISQLPGDADESSAGAGRGGGVGGLERPVPLASVAVCLFVCLLCEELIIYQ